MATGMHSTRPYSLKRLSSANSLSTGSPSPLSHRQLDPVERNGESSSGGAPGRVLANAAVSVGGVKAAVPALFSFSCSRSATKVALYRPAEKPATL